MKQWTWKKDFDGVGKSRGNCGTQEGNDSRKKIRRLSRERQLSMLTLANQFG